MPTTEIAPTFRGATGRKIRTDFIYPPIPVRDCDWQAVFDDDEPNDNGSMMAGRGRTEAEAVADLLDQEDAELPETDEMAAERRDTIEAYAELARFDAGGPAARLDEALYRDEHRADGCRSRRIVQSLRV